VEANATLSDPAKRERYDMGDDDDERMAGGHHGMSQVRLLCYFLVHQLF